jgi:hypothetical protein
MFPLTPVKRWRMLHGSDDFMPDDWPQAQIFQAAGVRLGAL